LNFSRLITPKSPSYNDSRTELFFGTASQLNKWLAGTPDHNDFITIQNKIDEFIENNNKPFIINSKLFKEIESLSDDFKTVLIDQDLPLRKHPLRFFTFDLQNLIDAITLAKLTFFIQNIKQ